jgi:hypothetical protein
MSSLQIATVAWLNFEAAGMRVQLSHAQPSLQKHFVMVHKIVTVTAQQQHGT